MTRFAKPTREQLKHRQKTLKQELIDNEAELEAAEKNNDLQAYKRAKVMHDVIMDDIESVIAKLHPHTPRSWLDRYGDLILPTVPKLKGSPNDGLIEE